jgi:hypothetical protein
MVEAPNPLGVHPTSMSYVYKYKVFQHLDMPWMGIWVYPYTVTPVQAGGEFWIIGVGRSLIDAVMSWLRLQTHLESTPHPCYMYTKCFSTLINCGWSYGCALALTLLPILLGSYFVVLCHLWSHYDVIMSWLRLTATSN